MYRQGSIYTRWIGNGLCAWTVHRSQLGLLYGVLNGRQLPGLLPRLVIVSSSRSIMGNVSGIADGDMDCDRIVNWGVESKGRCLGCQIGDPSGLLSISVTEVQDYSEKEKSQNRMWEILTIAQLEWDFTCLEWRQLSWYVGFGWPAMRHLQMTQCLGFWGKRPFESLATVLSSSNEPTLSHSFLCWATLRSVWGLSGKLLVWLHLSEKCSLVELIFIWPCSSLSILVEALCIWISVKKMEERLHWESKGMKNAWPAQKPMMWESFAWEKEVMWGEEKRSKS